MARSTEMGTRTLERVAWAREPGKWSVAHLRYPGEFRTLCSREVDRFAFDYRTGPTAEDHRGVCRQCWTRWTKIPEPKEWK